MFRSYILLSTRQETPKLLKSYTCSLRLHLMHLISIISFKLGHVSIPKRRSLSPLCMFCAYDSSVLQNFKISTNLLLHFSYSTLPLTKQSVSLVSNVITSTIGQEKFGKLSGFHFTTSRKRLFLILSTDQFELMLELLTLFCFQARG